MQPSLNLSADGVVLASLFRSMEDPLYEVQQHASSPVTEAISCMKSVPAKLTITISKSRPLLAITMTSRLLAAIRRNIKPFNRLQQLDHRPLTKFVACTGAARQGEQHHG